MSGRVSLLAVLLAASLLASLPVFAQQSSSSSGSGQSGQSQQTPPPAHKSAAQENPFPSDVSQHAAQPPSGDPTAPAAPDTPAAPDAPATPDASSPAASSPNAPDAGQQPAPPAQKPGDAAKDNPFPEDVSKGAAAAAAKDSDPNAASSSSSSGSSSSNPGGDADPNPDIPAEGGRRRLRKPSDKDIQSGSLAGEGKAKDDTRIGRFYLGDGNYQGAYGRFSEATRLDPGNVEAIYGLAAAAEGLHHHDEALTNYKLYLQVAPDGSQARAARKAIQSLSK